MANYENQDSGSSAGEILENSASGGAKLIPVSEERFSLEVDTTVSDFIEDMSNKNTLKKTHCSKFLFSPKSKINIS